MLFQKIRVSEISYFILFSVMVFFLIRHEPVYSSDAYSYLNFYLIRPPLYPIFLWLFHGSPYQINLVVWCQSILFFLSILYARHWLRINLKISDVFLFIMALVALLPASYHFINVIESEALAVPLFIFSFFLLIESLNIFCIKKLTFLVIFVSLLILTRSQFLYFYGFFVLWIVWHLWQRRPLKKIFYGTCVILISIIFTSLFDKSYHYVMNGTFSNAPVLGEQIFAQPLYLAHYDAVNYFVDSNERAHFKKILDKRDEKKISYDYFNNILTSIPPDPGAPITAQLNYELFNHLYVPLQFVIKELKATPNLTIQQYNNELIHMTKVFYLHDFKKNFIFFFTKWTQSLGGIPIFLCLLLVLIAFVVRIFQSSNWKPDIRQIFILITIITLFINNALIAFVEEGASRYFFYCYFIIWFLAVFLASHAFPKNEEIRGTLT